MNHKQIRWTIERAAAEFNINPRTLSNRLKQAGIEPGEDKQWSTAQIVRAIYSDLESERIRKTREEADQVALDNAERRGELIPKAEFIQVYSRIFVDVNRLIRSSKLTEVEQDELLSEIVKLHDLSGHR